MYLVDSAYRPHVRKDRDVINMRLAGLIGILLFIVTCNVNAAGATGEEESIADIATGRLPVTVSPNGRWRIHVNANGVLFRTSTTDPLASQSVQLPVMVKALSASDNADKVIFIADNSCVGVLTYPESSAKSQPVLTWFPGYIHGQIDKKLECRRISTTAKPTINNEPGRDYYMPSIAISKNGRLGARLGDGNSIEVLDTQKGGVVRTVPLMTNESSPVLGLRFIDNDQKLLLVNAIFGEAWEGEGSPSDMQYSVWDLRNGYLAGYYHTDNVIGLNRYDLFWDYSDITGELWAIGTRDWQAANSHPETPAPVTVRSINLKKCDQQPRKQVVMPATGWLAMQADPYGRWLAVVESVYDERSKQAKSRLVVRNTANAKVLASWTVESELKSLAVSPDGTVLYGVSSGIKHTGNDYSFYDFYFTGGGQVHQFLLDKQLAALPKQAKAEWGASYCRVENEAPGARNIGQKLAEVKLLHKLDLAWQLNFFGQRGYRDDPDQPLECYSSYSSTNQKWWLTDDGELWLDKGAQIERVALRTGKVMERIPILRTVYSCVMPLYKQRALLRWYGDTVAITGFDVDPNSKSATILAKKPGWTALTVDWREKRFGVRWIDNRYKNTSGKLIEGGAVAILYDAASGNVLNTVAGNADDGNAWWNEEECGCDEGGDVFASPTQDVGTSETLPEYSWSESYFGSIRAEQRDEYGATSTVLWDGLKLDSQVLGDSSVVPLGGKLAARRFPYGVDIYDAELRKKVAMINVSGVTNVRWNDKEKVLVIQVGYGDSSRLEFYSLKF